MRIFICCSKHFYDTVVSIRNQLEEIGHIVILPNSYKDPFKEEKMREACSHKHRDWQARMLKLSKRKIKKIDAILVLNLEKNGEKNYIGGATFLEIFEAWELGKLIFLLNPVPDNIFKDELLAMNPTVIHGNLSYLGRP